MLQKKCYKKKPIKIGPIPFRVLNEKLLHFSLPIFESDKRRRDKTAICRAVRNETKMTFKGARSRLPRRTYFRERIPP